MNIINSIQTDVMLSLWMDCPHCENDAEITSGHGGGVLAVNCGNCGYFANARIEPKDGTKRRGFVRVSAITVR